MVFRMYVLRHMSTALYLEHETEVYSYKSCRTLVIPLTSQKYEKYIMLPSNNEKYQTLFYVDTHTSHIIYMPTRSLPVLRPV